MIPAVLLFPASLVHPPQQRFLFLIRYHARQLVLFLICKCKGNNENTGPFPPQLNAFPLPRRAPLSLIQRPLKATPLKIGYVQNVKPFPPVFPRGHFLPSDPLTPLPELATPKCDFFLICKFLNDPPFEVVTLPPRPLKLHLLRRPSPSPKLSRYRE